MQRAISFIKKLRPEEVLALAMTTVGLAILIQIDPTGNISPTRILALLIRYFSFGDSFFALFFVFIWIGVFVHIFLRCSDLAVRHFVKKESLTRTDIQSALTTILTPVRLLLPIALVTIPAYGILGAMSIQFRYHTADIALNTADKILFGFSPFIHTPSMYHAPLLSIIVEYSYAWLGYILSATGIILFATGRVILLRRMIFAFLLSLVFSYPLFYVFPCQDPNNFFLRNLRSHSLPRDMVSEKNLYTPPTRVVEMIRVIERSETDTHNDNSVPVSCFPSSHAMWALLAVYFLAALSPWSLIISIPWLLFLLTGGIFFAQHYVIDYMIAIPITLLCIWLANIALPNTAQQ